MYCCARPPREKDGSVALSVHRAYGEADEMTRRRSCPPIQPGSAAFAGFRFPPEVILLAVRWYLRVGLSYDPEELLAERGAEVDHVTLHRWVQRFTPRSSTPPDRVATRPVTAGSSTRPA